MFLGHTNDVPLNGYILLSQFRNKEVLVNNSGEFKRVSNICPHQQSLISTKSGFGARVCGFHGWSFELGGGALGSETSCKNNSMLETKPVYVWNNLIFSEPIELSYNLNLQHMELVETRIDAVDCDQRNVMDLFLDVEHIPIVHKGVYDKIGLPNINEVQWDFFSKGSLQIVNRNSTLFDEHLIESERTQGAIWLAVYPNTMIEWQPGSLFITVSLGENKVLVYKYKDTRYSNQSFEINNDIWETAWEQDKRQCELLTEFTNLNLCEAKQHYRMFLSGEAP